MLQPLDIAVIDYDDICRAVAQRLGIEHNSSGLWNAPEADCFDIQWPTIMEDSGVLHGESKAFWRGYVEPDSPVTPEMILAKYPRIPGDKGSCVGKSQREIPFHDALELIHDLLPDSQMIVTHCW